MSAPIRRLEREVHWCLTCGTSQTDVAGWAEAHNAAHPGHTTARRQWSVDTWIGES